MKCRSEHKYIIRSQQSDQSWYNAGIYDRLNLVTGVIGDM